MKFRVSYKFVYVDKCIINVMWVKRNYYRKHVSLKETILYYRDYLITAIYIKCKNESCVFDNDKLMYFAEIIVSVRACSSLHR